MKEDTTNVEVTDIVADFFLNIIHEHYTNPMNKGDILMFFKKCESKCIRGWKKEMIKRHPYDFNQQLSKCTDVSKRKIERISLKE